MDSRAAYIEVRIEVVVEYKLLFPEAISYPTITSLLENIPRMELINILMLLLNRYTCPWVEAIKTFFTFPQSVEVRDFLYRFERAV